MRIAVAVFLAILLLMSTPSPILAKGKTVKITISGGDLKRPIEITDPNILVKFRVWVGPGTSSNDREGLIVDWSPGPVGEVPPGLPKYKVSFHTDPNDQLVYEVFYAVSRGADHGYVYVPGESDEYYGLNVRTIFRGVEGKWFRAWSAWEQVARPLIDKVG
ncbi:MAG TPA: hypothetical protein VNB49_05570 [Candidatus Dormibacteraeota bacterium]|nr:hypothetical protein [Candidatus Dormibacteraeota bacterium]